MITNPPFNYSDEFVDTYITNYLTKATTTLLNEIQLRVVIEPFANCINDIIGVFWESELPFAIKLLDSLYNIASVKKINEKIPQDEEYEHTNKVYRDLQPFISSSRKYEVRSLSLYLNQIWQLCQGRLRALKLDRIGESCDWITVKDVFLIKEYRIKNEERVMLVKQIIQDFLKGAIDAAKAELELREQEAKAQLQTLTVRTRSKCRARLFSEVEPTSESSPTFTSVPKNAISQNETAKPRIKRTRLSGSAKRR